MEQLQRKILVVDDETQIRKLLNIGLSSHNYKVLLTKNSHEALKHSTLFQPDLIILDLSLPDMSGYEFIKTLREWNRVPIIVLSIHKEEHEKILAFELGANDYITKPFWMGELIARVKAHLRDRIIDLQDNAVLQVGELIVDLAMHRVTVKGIRISLSPIEYKLLTILMRNSGKVVTHNQIIKEIWGGSYTNDNQYIRTYIRRLRQKIEKDKMLDQYIHSEPGIGYRIEYEK